MYIVKISPITMNQIYHRHDIYGSGDKYYKSIRNQLKEVNLELDDCYNYELEVCFYIHKTRMFNRGYDSSNLLKPLEEAIKPLIKVDDTVFSDIISRRRIVIDESDERIEFSIKKLDLSVFGERYKKFAEYLVSQSKDNERLTLKLIADYFDCSSSAVRRASKSSIFKHICQKHKVWFTYGQNIDGTLGPSSGLERTYSTRNMVEVHIRLGKNTTKRSIAKELGCHDHTVMLRQRLPEYWEEYNKQISEQSN